MSESLLLWLQGVCTVLQIFSILGIAAGITAIGMGTDINMPKLRRVGVWILCVSIVLLVVLPWPTLWNHWLDMARRP